MRKVLFAGASALALVLSVGAASADGFGGPGGPGGPGGIPGLNLDVNAAVGVNGGNAADTGGNAANAGSNAASKGGTIVTGSTLSAADTHTHIMVMSKNDLDAHFGGTSINTAAAASGGDGGGGACLGLVCGSGGTGGVEYPVTNTPSGA